mgnify:FL=1
MGSGSWTSHDWDSYSRSSISGKSAAGIYTSRSTANEFDPLNVTMRESRDGADHPESNAIIIGLDVTGSMSDILEGVAKKLNVLVTEVLNRKPIPDPQIMFNAIGDAMCDSSPFQVTQFESDIRIAEQLTKLYFEKGGGGNGFESYPLAWYFAANHTSIDCFEKRGKKGFLFTMGDDCFPKKLTKREIKDIFGDEISEDISVEALLAQVNRKYEVFHLILDRWGDSSRMDKWRELMGERAIKVSDYTKIPEVIVSILETMGGKDVDEVAASWDGTTSIVVKDALSGLKSVTAQSDLVKF